MAGVGMSRCTLPEVPSELSPSLRSLLQSMTVKDKIGQLICGRLSSTTVEDLVAAGTVGSLYGLLGNQDSARAVAEWLNHLQSIAKYPLLVMGEQEHGSARNMPGGTEFPAYMAIGATRSKELAYLVGKINTLEGQAVGYNWISCPTVDVNIEPRNPIINTRSLGERPELVTELGAETCRAVVENQGLTCVCHFPGHGATSRDSHVELPVVDRTREELHSVELAPYRFAISRGYMNCIMTAHIYYPALEPRSGLPATLSSNIMNTLLRKEFGYTGLVATDSLRMKAVADHFPIGTGRGNGGRCGM